ncbi:unnamed protein product [Prorocentrum cordatum]|uniref:Uncharacterized protein n=1 Tax=Prorocentrum cordatum TaxID=2364126 RepID=A0ABN9S9S4_9DINO|nr:unnamed protein product [Polarella glacialis]
MFQKPLPAADAALFNHSILLHERRATATHHLRAKNVRARLIRALRLELGLEADRIKIITFLPLPSPCPLLKCERCCIFQKQLPAEVAALFNHSILQHERCATATHHLRAK